VAQTVPSATTDALFVNDLFLYGGSQLIISNDMRLYFCELERVVVANVTLLGNAELHQLPRGELLVIPEPSRCCCGCGGVVLWLAVALRAMADTCGADGEGEGR